MKFRNLVWSGALALSAAAFASVANADGLNYDPQVSLNSAPAVPEPSTWAMMTLGFIGLAVVAYRRVRKAAPAH